MHDVKQVEENLAVIRRLMERGTRYEAITGPGAVAAGVAAAAAAAVVEWGPWRGDAAFILIWSFVAVAVAAGIAWRAVSASRAADPEGRRLSAQAVAVAREVLPAYVTGVVLASMLWREGRVDLLPPAWMLLHGVAILSTAHHAPRRLVALGVAFLLAGAAVGLLHAHDRLLMALVFGGFHVAYGVVAMLRPDGDDD